MFPYHIKNGCSVEFICELVILPRVTQVIAPRIELEDVHCVQSNAIEGLVQSLFRSYVSPIWEMIIELALSQTVILYLLV